MGSKAGWEKYKRSVDVAEAHFSVEGVAFRSAKHAFSMAKDNGFNGGLQTIADRLNAGVKTLKELCAPINLNYARGKDAVAATRKAKKDEMAELAAALDARKKAIQSRQDEEE